ncbi:cytochrome d ubiquinol oxidase subunit II [Brachybacterium sp. p3-SID957]|uniref:cytochrome d ubiquinol oxidase subunit II n=1 Tax=Brachybacterium sp. p3-SID957 TaxID=2916049 RepID=UPI00223B7998|nr:cytochrome d ubiquinol oxidase subunit II [Brachybacterium sp. p3-SID957]MCT1775162.1 cytochrome d ubiquinol oxidase subunit II [Brachybacterium sp. p3-SID957]
MDAMLDPTTLQTLWFALIAFFFVGYFMLEGFDFGVQMNVLALGRGDSERRSTIIKTIAPVWDGNQVWLLVGGASIFAAFPEWYATLFSGFYLALLLLLLVLIVRVCAFKYRAKHDTPTWTKTWDWIHILSGFLPALLWGVAFANIVRGVAIDGNSWVTTSLLGLLNPFGLLGGIVFVLLFWLHGTLYLTVRTVGELREDANRLAGILILPTIVAGAAFLIWYQLAYSHSALTWVPLLIAALALVAVLVLNRMRREGAAFTASMVAILGAGATLFGGLFPYVLPATNDAANSLTVAGASSSEHTLLVMTIAVVVFMPIVLAYEIWSFWVFRHRIAGPDDPQPPGLVERARGAYREAFDQDGGRRHAES